MGPRPDRRARPYKRLHQEIRRTLVSLSYVTHMSSHSHLIDLSYLIMPVFVSSERTLNIFNCTRYYTWMEMDRMNLTANKRNEWSITVTIA